MLDLDHVALDLVMSFITTGGGMIHPQKMREDIRAALAAEREGCAVLADDQPYYPDADTGMRQQWLKNQIAAAIRGRG